MNYLSVKGDICNLILKTKFIKLNHLELNFDIMDLLLWVGSFYLISLFAIPSLDVSVNEKLVYFTTFKNCHILTNGILKISIKIHYIQFIFKDIID